eukprot:CAMPEP_0172775486 /NCGR_PEP_ID=MMETSP1074-20121228/198061_1 /TAXON_ID=2916 /ORGANISM="Ceratium fusus, Strain PA161109" /LENGTH=232 /DNA_ID=CAMNT_0013612107 /DNA_START=131 /DNA_END=826 /DNA_ORIENTATION=+
MSKYIKKRLYGGPGKIGWGYYKGLPKGVSPDDHSFNHKIELISIADDATVVDLGCGHGWFASRLATRFPKATVYGFDVDPKCIETAIASCSSCNLHFAIFKESFVEALPLDCQGHVDAVFVIGVANELSLDRLKSLLCDVHEQLRPHGRVYISFIDVVSHHWDGLALAFATYAVPMVQAKGVFLQFAKKQVSHSLQSMTTRPTLAYPILDVIGHGLGRSSAPVLALAIGSCS